MRLARKDNTLNDAIEVLDAKFEAVGNFSQAWETLDKEELDFVDREIGRCISDRRYFLENYFAIRNEHGQMQTLFPFWPHQEIIFSHLQREWDEKGCFRGIILKPRQCGGTAQSSGIVFHATIFTPQAYTLVMAHEENASAELYRRIWDALNNLPWWMRPEMASKQQERHIVFQRPDEKRRIVSPGLGSTLIISNAQKSAGVAIGRSIRSAHFSEVSRYPDATVYTADIKPSMNARDILAIMESTAFGRTGLFWNMWKAAESGKSAWTPIFIPVYRVPKYFIPVAKTEKFVLTTEESALRDNVKENENFTIPLGFFKWRRNDIKETENATGSDETHYEAYPVTAAEAFISSGLCAFPKKCLNEQERENVRPPKLIGEVKFTSIDGSPELTLHPPSSNELLEKPVWKNRFWVWEEPDANETVLYFIGCDVSGGDGGDYSDIAIYRPDISAQSKYTQVAEWHGLINPSHLAKVLVALGNWYHRAEIAVEYNGPGITTGNDLMHTLDYPNLYRWKHLDKLTGSLSQHVHWVTNSRSRPDMINRFNEALLDKSVVLRNRHLIEEMRDFGRYEDTSRVEGIDNNDDMVLANCIALYIMCEYIRLNGEWGIDSAAPTAHSVMPQAPQIYGVYNQFMQQVHQAPTEEKAREWVKLQEAKYKVSLASWRIVPVMVMHANTAWSPIHDGAGAERELYQMGVSPRDITPDVINSYRQSTPSQLSPSSYMDGDD